MIIFFSFAQANVEQTWIDMVKGIRDVTPSDSPDAEIDDDLLKHLSTFISFNEIDLQLDER